MKKQLVGVAEIAKLSGFTKPAVSNWIKRYESFPRPVVVLTMGSVYDWFAIKQWLRANGRIA